MSFFKGIPAVLLLAAAVIAQQDPGYNYPKPEPPRGTYLPPPGSPPPANRPPPPPPPPPQNQQQVEISPEGINPDGEHEPGMPFDFTYAVKDDVGNDFSHNANSDGEVVQGEYRTLLPDGRLQIVKYTADWKNGYNAEITYEGEANYPEPPPQRPQGVRPESQTEIDSQGIRPEQARPPPPPPPPTYRPAPPQTRPPPPPQTRPPTPQQTRPPPPPPPPQTRPPPTYRPAPPQTQPPRLPQTQPPAPPTYRPAPPQTSRPVPPPTSRPAPQPQPTQPPVEPPGLYGAPSLPFGVRNNPKFGYQQ